MVMQRLQMLLRVQLLRGEGAEGVEETGKSPSQSQRATLQDLRAQREARDQGTVPGVPETVLETVTSRILQVNGANLVLVLPVGAGNQLPLLQMLSRPNMLTTMTGNPVGAGSRRAPNFGKLAAVMEKLAIMARNTAMSPKRPI